MFTRRGTWESATWRNLSSARTTLKEKAIVEVRIGIINAGRELSFETSSSATEIEAAVAAALASPTGHLKLSDDKGKTYIVPTAALGFIEVGNEESRRVGFVA